MMVRLTDVPAAVGVGASRLVVELLQLRQERLTCGLVLRTPQVVAHQALDFADIILKLDVDWHDLILAEQAVSDPAPKSLCTTGGHRLHTPSSSVLTRSSAAARCSQLPPMSARSALARPWTRHPLTGPWQLSENGTRPGPSGQWPASGQLPIGGTLNRLEGTRPLPAGQTPNAELGRGIGHLPSREWPECARRSCAAVWRACREPRWKPPGRTTFQDFGLTRTAGRDASEAADCSERVRMPVQVPTDQPLVPLARRRTGV